jgi:hypothetical protein
MRASIVGATSDVLEAAADVLGSVLTLERRLRTLASILRDAVPTPTRQSQARHQTRPTATVEFSEVDAAKADRALARLGVRRSR